MLAPSQPAYVLHSRAYRESSALVDFLTPQGRLRAVLRGARGKAGSLARPFIPLELETRGRGELKNVGRLEAAGIPNLLTGEALFSGLYLNELLIRVLPAEDPHPVIFEHYAMSILALAQGRPLEPILRAFEWRLLDELGYGFALDSDVQGNAVVSDGLYRLEADSGFLPIGHWQPGAFLGREAAGHGRCDWSTPGALAAAKRLMRQALAPHLGGRPWSAANCS